MDELVTTAILLLNAGHEATVHGIGNAVKALLEQDMAREAMLADLRSNAVVVDELLRFDPPLHLFTRFVLEDLVFAGHETVKGTNCRIIARGGKP